MLVGLRTRVDAVMIGAGTMRAERYGRVIGDPAKRERREREGLPPDPLMVIVSGRLDLPWDAPLFTEGDGRVPDRDLLGAPTRPRPRPRSRSCASRTASTCAALLAHLRARARRPGAALRGRAAAARPADRAPAWSTSCSSPTRRSSPAASAPGWSPGCAERERPLELAWLLARRRERRAVRPLPRAARLIAPGSVGREPASGRSPAQTAPGIGSWSDSSSGISPPARPIAARRGEASAGR